MHAQSPVKSSMIRPCSESQTWLPTATFKGSFKAELCLFVKSGSKRGATLVPQASLIPLAPFEYSYTVRSCSGIPFLSKDFMAYLDQSLTRIHLQLKTPLACLKSFCKITHAFWLFTWVLPQTHSPVCQFLFAKISMLLQQSWSI